ncbi:hypothetical protein HMN09_00748700 [Mycena chlorophos]|uniref:Uncharacterized protein n=1 Tax=Mycena chlorophos TaxID=658473 RepID=A0A8H6W8U8_MYCCL|nr:hypothetical protein HMN09_00748700 [Mycena chlorophos]
MNVRFQPTNRPKPLPKSYTEQQLAFLRSHLPEYERRSHGPFIARFGLPENVDLGQDVDARYKEQLYCWYKNTSGRNRRKADGKPKPSSSSTSPPSVRKTTTTTTTTTEREWEQFPETSPSPTITLTDTTSPPTIHPRIPVTYNPGPSSTLANALQPSPSPPPPPPPPVTLTSLRDAFLSPTLDASLLASQIHAFIITNPPSPLPLTPILGALFQAISSEWDKSGSPPNAYLTRFLAASKYFSVGIVHAGTAGPMAGSRALHMHIRKTARWTPSPANTPSTSMSAELQRMTLDRARRKEHILWARIHASALEVGAFTFGWELQQQQHGVPSEMWAESRVFSELFVSDVVWEDDEVEWVAGALVLHSLIRTYYMNVHGMPMQQHPRTEKRRKYEELVARYEERWKEMKDETRQAIVTDALLGAKAELTRIFGS